jgi:hypothetical protein
MVLASGAEVAPVDIDLTFSPAKHVWTGTWTAWGEATSVSLTRPEAAQRTGVDPIVGDWKYVSSETSSAIDGTTTLYIRRSADDVLTAWMNSNSTVRATDPTGTIVRNSGMRSGEPLRVVSFDKTEIHLATNNSSCCNKDYIGKLSADGNSLNGAWHGGQGTLDSQTNFHRATQ